MNLTDIIPPGQWDYLSHFERDKDRDARFERIMKAYSADVLKCLLECGPMTDDPQQEYKLTMALLCLVDVIIERATRSTQ